MNKLNINQLKLFVTFIMEKENTAISKSEAIGDAQQAKAVKDLLKKAKKE
jgi:hypothetical protein